MIKIKSKIKKNKSLEMIARVIIKRSSKILLCKNIERGIYYLPGGHVEFGDSLEKTIYKEMNEELGFKKTDITNISFKSHLEQVFMQEGEKHHELNMIYTAEIPGDINIESKEEHISFDWIDVKDIKNIKLLPEKIIPILK